MNISKKVPRFQETRNLRLIHNGFAEIAAFLPSSVRARLRAVYKRIAPQRAFSLHEAMNWLRTLRECGVIFGFPEDLADSGGGADRLSLAVLKHDIHDTLDRAVAMAEAEHGHAISALYFMMGPHELNRAFYGNPRSWEQLRTIQKLGHRIGLHLDAFDALRRTGLYEFVRQTLSDFSREGIEVHYGNSHGDRRWENMGVSATDLFSECVGRRTGATKVRSNFVKGHLGKYSLRYLAEHFGLEYWVDGRVWRNGRPLNRTIYVSDNTGSIEIGARGISSKRFEIDKGFIAASAPLLASAQSLILLHPQWYLAKP